jgi:hypothetical protein
MTLLLTSILCNELVLQLGNLLMCRAEFLICVEKLFIGIQHLLGHL